MAGNGEESVPASPAESPSKKGSWFFRRNSRVGPSDLSFHSPNPVLAGEEELQISLLSSVGLSH
eukprot:m.308958 g.308958  ORF g.308958 m.308958 type:complete len:64 (-) comp23029_c0_seq40:45-236(-)